MPASGHAPVRCGRRSSLTVKRLLPGALLLLLLLRLLWPASQRPLAPLAILLSLAAVFLGGCLWWVAQRQSSPGAGLFVLALYSAIAATRGNILALLPALGIFAMLYTGVGVAHALHGPRNKWPPRIVLMALLSAFTAWAQPMACTAALLLTLAVSVRLLERERQRPLLPLFALWTVCGALGDLHPLNRRPVLVHLSWLGAAGVLATLAAALLLWAGSRRSRFFGNTAPLLGALSLLCLTPVLGPEAWLWALPPALVFAAGVFADGFEGPARSVWMGLAAGLVLFQFAVSR